MRMILWAILLAISFAAFANAQDEMTGEFAEKAKKQIIELENTKVKMLLSKATVTADWYEKNITSDVVYTGPGGSMTKTQLLAFLRSGPEHPWGITAVNHHDYHIRIYGVGNNPHTAIVSYVGDETAELDGKRTRNYEVTTDVFVKLDDKVPAGKGLEEIWRRAVHHVTRTKLVTLK